MTDTKQTKSPAKPGVIPSLLEMLKAGVHFGHLTSKWHPKMRPHIFAARQGVHIINLETTRKQLEAATKFISEVVAKGGTVLFVATKKQVRETLKQKVEPTGMPYVHERWIGGLLTNFEVIGKMIKRHQELGRLLESVDLEKLVKKERLERKREYDRLQDVIGGITNLAKIPDAIFIIDIAREKTALKESNKVGVPVVGVCDTNCNPELVKYPIAANDDAVGSLNMMIDLAVAAVEEGKKRRPATVAPATPAATPKA